MGRQLLSSVDLVTALKSTAPGIPGQTKGRERPTTRHVFKPAGFRFEAIRYAFPFSAICGDRQFLWYYIT